MRNKILILCLIFLSSTAYGQIIATYSINSITIKKIEEFVDENTIILVGIDGTLVVPKSLMFNPNGLYKNFIKDLLVRAEKFPIYKRSIENWYNNRELMLVEKDWPAFIERMKSKGASVYGLCSVPITIKGIEQKVVGQLRSLGINFTEKVNQDTMLRIANQGDSSSIFYHGVLFTGSFSKTKSFLDLMKISNISPQKIIVFDNIKYILRHFDNALKFFNISFYNIEYLAPMSLPGEADPNVVKLQQQYLIEKGIWLEDERAKKLLPK
jgi:hypothetical protein